MVYFQAKNPNFLNLGGSWNGKGWYILRTFGIGILRPLGTFGTFGNLVAIWYIFPSFGIFCQEKSVNPDADLIDLNHRILPSK
jgi:hypothetical protein